MAFIMKILILLLCNYALSFILCAAPYESVRSKWL